MIYRNHAAEMVFWSDNVFNQKDVKMHTRFEWKRRSVVKMRTRSTYTPYVASLCKPFYKLFYVFVQDLERNFFVPIRIALEA